jgi:hypothetical protein
MIKKLLLPLAALLVWVLLATPAFAYSGIVGNVIDSETAAPWSFGADIYVVGSSSGLIASDHLGANGSFNIAYLTDNLGVCPSSVCNTPLPGERVTVYLDFTCGQSADCNGLGPAPSGPPGTAFKTYTEQSALNFRFGLGYVQTGTSPNAVSLASFGAQANHTWWAAGLAALALVALAAAVTLRRHPA